MKLYFRLLWLFLTQSRRARCSALGPCTSSFRVLLNDLDALLHVNNGVYLTLMDLGRTDLLLRSDTVKALRKQGWYPVLAAETIRFKRSLKLWQRFTITTRVIGWDEKSVYLEQVFKRADTLVAHAVVDARFLSKKGGTVPTSQLLPIMKIEEQSPELPAWVQSWVQSNQQAASVEFK